SAALACSCGTTKTAEARKGFNGPSRTSHDAGRVTVSACPEPCRHILPLHVAGAVGCDGAAMADRTHEQDLACCGVFRVGGPGQVAQLDASALAHPRQVDNSGPSR